MTHGEQRDLRSVGIGRSEGDVGAVVTGHDNWTHTGSGHQISTDLVILADGFGRQRRKQPRLLSHSAEQREYLRKRFVPPPRFDEAAEQLAKCGTVFLAGPPGSGRKSAAMMLLWEHSPDQEASCRRLTLDGDDELPLDPESVQNNELLIFDMSGKDDEDRFTLVRSRWNTFRASVERNSAALVVVLPPDWDHPLFEEFAHPRVDIGRPDGAAVLGSHLAHAGVSVEEGALSPLSPYVASATMRDIERLAQRIMEAKRERPRDGLASWVARAQEAVTQYGAKVADHVRGCDPASRALLLAAAMLDGAHADAAHAARERLLARLAFPDDERHVLEREGLDEALRGVGVEIDTSRRVRFPLLRYSEAVRDHFWTNYPELRESLRDWMDDCMGISTLTDDDRDRLVERFARQACRVGRVSDLCALADRWSGGRGRERRPAMPWAASALAYALRYGGGARAVRRKIYEWARDHQQDVGLARVLVTVCANVLADGYPEQALVRLRLLAAHESYEVASAARAAVRDLAGHTPFYRRFLWRMTVWLDRARPADAALFLTVTRPEQLVSDGTGSRSLIGNTDVRRQLVACWRTVFTIDDSLWREPVCEWFGASHPAAGGDRLLDVLVEAAGARLPVLATLHVLARDWSHRSSVPEQRRQRHEIFRALSFRMDRAQGLPTDCQETAS